MLHIREYVTFTTPNPVSCSKTHLKTRTIPRCMYQKSRLFIRERVTIWTRLKLPKIGGQLEGKPLQVELFLTAALQIMLCNYGLGASAAPRAALGCNSRTASSIHLQYFFLPLRWATASGLAWVASCYLKANQYLGFFQFKFSYYSFYFPKYFLYSMKVAKSKKKNSDLTASQITRSTIYLINFVFSWILLAF